MEYSAYITAAYAAAALLLSGLLFISLRRLGAARRSHDALTGKE